ncbi:MAG: hypothetical protein NTY77_07095 [Elusimicrobia bacterium]|nr:hypothetical protein [Elusimicrobiota bacterium]
MRRLAERLLAACLGLCAAIVIMEGALYLRGDRRLEPDRNFSYLYLDMYRPSFKRVVRDGKARYESVRPRLRPQSFPERKGPSTKRVFIIGSSTAQNFPPDILARKLRQVLPQSDFQVINCGMGMFDAYRTLLMGREILGYAPDLVVFIAGNTEVPGTRRVNPWKYEGALSYSAVFRRLCDLLGPQVDVLLTGLDRYYFEALERFADEAARRGVPVVLCTLPVNYRDNHFSSKLVPFQDDFILMLEALRRGNLAAAQGLGTALESRYPGSALVAYCQGLIAERRGRYDQARSRYARALERDPSPMSCTPTRNQGIRDLAARYGLPLADLERRFIAFAPHGIPGFDLFEDNCHVWPPAYELYADAIIDALFACNASRGTGILAPGGQWRMANATRLTYPELMARLDRKVAAERAAYPMRLALFDILGGGALSPLSSRAIQTFESVLGTHPEAVLSLRTESREWAARLRRDVWLGHLTRAIDRGWWRVLLNAGEALRRQGRYREARLFFDEAGALQRDNVAVRYLQGLTHGVLLSGSLGPRGPRELAGAGLGVPPIGQPLH